MAEVLLCIDAISKRFGGLLAVDKASFNVRPGHVTALIGPNGAGKTTLFAIISGFLTPDEGRIVYNGTEITGAPPHILARRGIARTFQIVQPVAGLTVRENIAVGAHLAQPNRVDALAFLVLGQHETNGHGLRAATYARRANARFATRACS